MLDHRRPSPPWPDPVWRREPRHGRMSEVIEPTALRGARLDDLTLTVEHAGVPLGRYPRTLELQERSDGLHWSAEPPQSRQDVIEAVQRGDLRAASWRMRVGRDEWHGDVRHVQEIAELRMSRSRPTPPIQVQPSSCAPNLRTRRASARTHHHRRAPRRRPKPAGAHRVRAP